MKARRRLTVAVLLLLLLLGGTMAIVALDPADGERGAIVDDAARVEAETESQAERHRVRVSDAPETADKPPREPATTTTTTTITSRVRGPSNSAPPPTTGPVRIRREEPSGDEEQAALRIRVDDGAGAARDDVRLSVIASTNGTRGTRFAGTISATGVLIDDVDAGWATISLTAGSLSRTTRVKVEAGLLTDVALTLRQGATVTGEVRHREHGLLAGLTVDFGTLVRNRNSEGIFHDAIRGATDAEGVYRLTGIPPGQCTLTFKGGPLGFGLQPRTSFAVPVADEVRHDVLLGTVSLEGVVRDGASRTPIANAKVTVQSPHYASTTTDTDGSYTFIDLLPGEHKLCISSDGYGVIFTESGSVFAGRATRCDVDLAAAVSLTLHVTDDEGAPVTAEVIVSFSPKEGTTGTGVTTNLRPDGNGHLTYEKVVVGSYEISVRDRLGGYARSAVDAVLEPGPNELEIVLPRSTSPEVHILVEGTVRSAETGQPVADAEIQSVGRAITGADGRFVLRGYGGRPGFVYVRCDGYGEERAEIAEEGPVEIVLRRAAELILRVRGKDGAPFVGRLRLSFTPQDEGGARVGAGVEADVHGVAAFRRVIPGRYALSVGNDATGRAELEIEIQPGRNEIDVDLR